MKIVDGFTIRKIPAITAKELLDSGTLSINLSALRIWIEIGGLPLTDEVILAKVADWEVLSKLEVACYEYNYGFLRTWDPQQIPSAMAATYFVAESRHVDAIVSALVSNELATYKELRDEYSLEEAFKLLDVLAVKRINEFRAREAAKS
jgi:hypothetical protein